MANKQSGTMLRTIFMFVPLLGLACIILSFVFAVRSGQFTMPTIVGLILGHLLCLTLFIKAEVANLKYYLHVFIYSALVFGICIIGYLFVNQRKHQLDLTKERLYSLNVASENYLRRLTKDVNIVLFAADDQIAQLFQQIEDMYAGESEKLRFERINPIKDRLKATDRARELGITKPSLNDIVIKSGTKTKRMTVNDLMAGNYENVLTNAIVEVTTEGTRKVYFTTGHGELPFEAAAQRRRGEPRQESVQIFRKFLGDRGMETAQLDLLARGGVPDDATAVVIAGPTGDFSDKEVAALSDYLDKRAGHLLALVGPTIEQQRSESFEKLGGLLGNYGVELPNDIVLDLLSSQIGDAASPIVGYMDPNHPITKDLANARARATISLVRPVTTTRVGDPKIQATELIRSSEQSFLWPISEALAGQRPRSPEQSALKAQPMGVAVGMSEPPQMPNQPPIPKPKSYRLVVFGTADLVADQTLANQQLFQILMLNTMNWLTESENALNIAPRKLPGTPIILDAAQQRVMFVFAVILLPELLFFGGISYSLRRRNK